MNQELERLLLKVQKPGRYTGGEPNSVIKDKMKLMSALPSAFPIPTRWGCRTLA